MIEQSIVHLARAGKGYRPACVHLSCAPIQQHPRHGWKHVSRAGRRMGQRRVDLMCTGQATWGLVFSTTNCFAAKSITYELSLQRHIWKIARWRGVSEHIVAFTGGGIYEVIPPAVERAQRTLIEQISKAQHYRTA